MSKVEQVADQPEKAHKVRKDAQSAGANRYAGRGGSPRYLKPPSRFLKLFEFCAAESVGESRAITTEMY